MKTTQTAVENLMLALSSVGAVAAVDKLNPGAGKIAMGCAGFRIGKRGIR
jgi:hypothetical protein